jgi:hypothetical protein
MADAKSVGLIFIVLRIICAMYIQVRLRALHFG